MPLYFGILSRTSCVPADPGGVGYIISSHFWKSSTVSNSGFNLPNFSFFDYYHGVLCCHYTSENVNLDSESVKWYLINGSSWEAVCMVVTSGRFSS